MDLISPWLDYYVELIGVFLQDQTVLAPLLLLFIEEAGVPILVPGDSILAFTGYSVHSSQQSSLLLAFAAAIFAVVLGASILFFMARRFGRKFVIKFGKFIFLRESHLIKAEELFKRYGVWTIIFGRHLPGMRIPITIFAAISGIRYRTFILSTLASTVLWVYFYLLIGKRYGGSLIHLLRKSTGLTVGVLIAIIAIVLILHFYGAHREKHNR